MRASVLLSLVALAHQAISSRYPGIQWDPATTKDCVAWYDNDEGKSCGTVRKYFKISPEEFHEWNPGVSLNCEPWEYQSYCIVTQEKVNRTRTTTKSTTTLPATTTSASTLRPSPTAWEARGCYVDDPKSHDLQKNLSPTRDASLTIPNCKTSCYHQAHGFAGVEQGNQCWCGNYVGGEWSKNQTDCSEPCAGDKNTFCGGKGFLNVFKALENRAVTSSTSSIKGSSTSARSVAPSQTGAAAKNTVALWRT